MKKFAISSIGYAAAAGGWSEMQLIQDEELRNKFMSDEFHTRIINDCAKFGSK